MKLPIAFLLCFVPVWAVTPVAPHKKPVKTSTAASKKGRAKTATNSKAASRLPARRWVKGTNGKRGHYVTVAAGPPRQMQPTPERYKEIQQALAGKGYLKTEPTGVWDQESQDAMRRFQADQKLEETGKLNAKSLISLGLGPKTASMSSTAPANP